MHVTDRASRNSASGPGEERVTLGWRAARLQSFVDLHP